MTETIDIKPRVNPERVVAYAERVQSKAPWEHIGGQLHALSTLSAKYDELSERLHGDELAWQFVREFGDLHRSVSNEFLGMFVEGSPLPEVPA